nr:hypothetical protein [Candidatus Njordarchaeota archaeon]
MEIKPNYVRTAIEDRLYRMEVETKSYKAGVLKGPSLGIMRGNDSESITTQVRLVLRRIDRTSRKSAVIINDLGKNTSLEIMDRNELRIS